MKKSVLITIAIFINIFCQAQILDNKFNLYFGHSIGGFKGDNMYSDGTFSSPLLFPNYDCFKGSSIKVLYNKQFLSFGINLDKLKASDWQFQQYDNFASTETKIHSVAPTIQLHNKFNELGFENRVKFFVEIAPTFGTISLIWENSVYEPRHGNHSTSQPMVIKDITWSIKGSAGIEVMISQRTGLYLAYTLDHRLLNYFPDESYTSLMLNMGLFLKMYPNKDYYN